MVREQLNIHRQKNEPISKPHAYTKLTQNGSQTSYTELTYSMTLITIICLIIHVNAIYVGESYLNHFQVFTVMNKTAMNTCV